MGQADRDRYQTELLKRSKTAASQRQTVISLPAYQLSYGGPLHRAGFSSSTLCCSLIRDPGFQRLSKAFTSVSTEPLVQGPIQTFCGKIPGLFQDKIGFFKDFAVPEIQSSWLKHRFFFMSPFQNSSTFPKQKQDWRIPESFLVTPNFRTFPGFQDLHQPCHSHADDIF